MPPKKLLLTEKSLSSQKSWTVDGVFSCRCHPAMHLKSLKCHRYDLQFVPEIFFSFTLPYMERPPSLTYSIYTKPSECTCYIYSFLRLSTPHLIKRLRPERLFENLIYMCQSSIYERCPRGVSTSNAPGVLSTSDAPGVIYQ